MKVTSQTTSSTSKHNCAKDDPACKQNEVCKQDSSTPKSCDNKEPTSNSEKKDDYWDSFVLVV